MFRREALEHVSARLEGELILDLPRSWTAVVAASAVAALAAVVFLTTGSYARTEMVRGTVIPTAGTSMVRLPRPGTVTAVHVVEGQRVRAGAPLLDVAVQAERVGDRTMVQTMAGYLDRRADSLDDLSASIRQQAAAETRRRQSEVRGIGAVLTALRGQIEAQGELVAKSEAELRSIQPIVERGFVSGREAQQRSDVVLSRRRELAALRQQEADLIGRMREAEGTILERDRSYQVEMSRLASTRTELLGQKAELDDRRGYTLVAPVDGEVTNVVARQGQMLQASEAAMMILPGDGSMEVEVRVPTRAAGRLNVGQEVRVQIDAFPHEHFGTLAGRIRRMPAAASLSEKDTGGDDGTQEAFYLVGIAIDTDRMRAFGRTFPIRPGMSLTASIVTERRSLLQWLFAPIFAAGGRS